MNIMSDNESHPNEEKELKKELFELLKSEFRKRNDLLREAGNRAQNFLTLINTGGTLALLSFLGAFPSLSNSRISFFSLACFVLGVVFNGFVYAIYLHAVHKMAYQVNQLAGEIVEQDTYNEMREIYANKVEGFNKINLTVDSWLFLFGYLSFIFFLLGVGLAFWAVSMMPTAQPGA